MPRPSMRSASEEDTNNWGTSDPAGGILGGAQDVRQDTSVSSSVFAQFTKEEKLVSKPLRELAGPAPATPNAGADDPALGCEVEVEVKEKPAKKHRRAKTKEVIQREQEFEGWSPTRQFLSNVLSSGPYQAAIGTVIVFNVILMCVEGSIRAKCYPEECDDNNIIMLNRILLLIYLTEVSVKLYVDRGKFHMNRWNLMDVAIVTLGIFDEFVSLLLQGVEFPAQAMWPMLRLLRVTRLMRAVHLLKHHEELYVMVRGFLGAMRAMFWGFVMIILLLILWALVFIELVNPINKDMWAEVQRTQGAEAVDQDCVQWFITVPDIMLFLFQVLVAGDNWGQCINPIIKYQPLTFMAFAAALMSVTLGFMNLILAVVVDRACAARDEDREQQLNAKMEDRLNALNHWGDLMKELDVDQSGAITYEELMAGWENAEVQDALHMLGMDEDDLTDMFELVDTDGSGDIDYKEFLDCFIKAEKHDLRPNVMMTKLQAASLGKQVKTMRTSLDRLTKGDQSLKDEIMKLEQVSANMANHLATLEEQDRRMYNSFAGLDKAVAEGAASRLEPEVLSQAPAPMSGAVQVPAPLSAADGTVFQEDFQRIMRSIQDQFEALSRSVEMNTTMLVRNAKALESAAADQGRGVMGKAANAAGNFGDKSASAGQWSTSSRSGRA